MTITTNWTFYLSLEPCFEACWSPTFVQAEVSQQLWQICRDIRVLQRINPNDCGNDFSSSASNEVPPARQKLHLFS